MKKTGICKLASFLFWGLIFISVESSPAQQAPTALAKIRQTMLAAIKQTTGLEIAKASSLPPVELLVEPQYTFGDVNIVYWRPFADSITFQLGGKDTVVAAADCEIWVWYGLDSLTLMQEEPLDPFPANIDSVQIPNEILFNGRKESVFGESIYYIAALTFGGDSVSVSDPSITIQTIHDVTKPSLDALTIRATNGDSLHNGWFNAVSLDFSYYGLSDMAGLYNACLKLARKDSVVAPLVYCDTLLQTVNGGPGPPLKNDTLSISILTSGIYDVWLEARDAAYTPQSHGPGDGVDAVWRIDGNRADSLGMTRIRIDHQPPIVDYSLIKSTYSDGDLAADGTFKVSVVVYDALSGVDKKSIQFFGNSDILTVQKPPYDIKGSDTLQVDVRISGVPEMGITEEFTLYARVTDLAGNTKDDSMKIRIVIDPVKFTFQLFDVSPPPNSARPGFANDSIVGWQYQSQRFEESDVEKLVFYPAEGGAGSATWLLGEPKLLNLNDLFGDLISDSLYIVAASVTLKNGLQSDLAALPTDSIYFDSTPPMISFFHIQDIDPSPAPAAPGFSNSDTVSFSLAASDSGGLFSLIFEGDVHDMKIVFPDTEKVTLEGSLYLVKTGDVTKTAIATLRDSAGNWSSDSTSIKLVQQNILVDVLSDTITVAMSGVTVSETVAVVCKYPQFLQQVFTRDSTMAVSDVLIQCEAIQDSLYRCLLNVPFRVFDDQYNTVSLSDSAGSLSNPDTLFFDVQMPPMIDMRLYDYSEYDENNRDASDFLYTDEMKETKKIVAVVQLVGGAWSRIKIAFSEQQLENADWTPLASNSAVFDTTVTVDDGTFQDCEIVMYAMAVNKLGDVSDVVSAFILHDTTPPLLDDFDADLHLKPGAVSIVYTARDTGACASHVAGIILKDVAAATGEQTWFYLPAWNEEQSISPPAVNGLHHLVGFVVDSADVDQNVGPFSGKSLQALEQLWRADRGGRLDHQSDSLRVSFNWQVGAQGAGDVAYNYPNPFNPENGDQTTSFYIPVAKDMRVDLRIFDLFGHLVREKLGVKYTAVFEAGSGGALQWDGRNGRGELVASGVYLAIIRLENGETLEPIKVGVLRKN